MRAAIAARSAVRRLQSPLLAGSDAGQAPLMLGFPSNVGVLLQATADPARYSTVIVWGESFSQFITAAKYR